MGEQLNIGHEGVPKLQLWGGVECTVNRVHDEYFDQMQFSGHYSRISDLERFASLGIEVLRYPVLWEHIEVAPGKFDWTWADERLAKLRELGIAPLVGLVHHGSGPRWTSLVDPEFPEKLANFAAAVAERYPWIELYNPINEPLTTARFTGLYGHWYPHGTDPQCFATCLLSECRGVILAMRAIRRVNPQAQLIQTDDMGKTHSTPRLRYQAEFENERRMIAFDLLFGRVDTQHFLYRHLKGSGVTDEQLAWFRDNPCPPDCLGLNYYITSERYIDEKLHNYPARAHGGNGKESYADVEAVRVPHGIDGPETILREAWERFKTPIAVTEAHLSCTREEQMRWLYDIWRSAKNLNEEGIPVRAVTVWSLLGAYDWNSLLTRLDGYYESGLYDLRSGEPRETALGTLCRDLAAHAEPSCKLLSIPGWWRRAERLEYGAVAPDICMKNSKLAPQLLITGATGTLGSAFARLCQLRGIPYRIVSRKEMDIASPAEVRRMLEETRPWALVNAAGYVRVDDAEDDARACLRENTEGPAVLAAECARMGVRLVTFSSDLVFDGRTNSPYVETDKVQPLSVYGRSKAEAENRVLELHENSLVVRTSAFFGPWDHYNFITLAVEHLTKKNRFIACSDATISPTYVPDLVNGSLDLLIDGEHGLWHIANKGEATWAELAQEVAKMAKLDPKNIEARPTEEMGYKAERPKYSVLSSERGLILPALDNALERYFDKRQAALLEAATAYVS